MKLHSSLSIFFHLLVYFRMQSLEKSVLLTSLDNDDKVYDLMSQNFSNQHTLIRVSLSLHQMML